MTRRDPVLREDGGTRRDGYFRPDRIVVPLGGAEHSLTEAEATRLRDELTAALTPGSEPADSAQFTDDHPLNAIVRAALVELRDRRAADLTPRATPSVLGELLVAQNADLTTERDGLRTGGYASPEEQDVLRAAERALAGEDRLAP